MMEASAVARMEPGGRRAIGAAMRIVRDELTVTPDRWARMLRMTALVTVVVVISNALRVPELALSAYMIFFFSKADVVATIRTGIAAVIGLTLVLVLVFVLYSTTFGEPALRLLAMGCAIFVGFYLLRSSPVGPLGLLIGLAISYALSYVDSDASPEKLVRGLLWIWVVISYPIAVLVASDLALGRRPAELFRKGVSARLRAAGARLAGEEGAVREECERLERLGTAELSPYAKAEPPAAVKRARLLAQVDLLFLLLRELPEGTRSVPALAEALVAAGEATREAGDALLAKGHVPGDRLTAWEQELEERADLPPEVLAVVLPLLAYGLRRAEVPKPRMESSSAASVDRTDAVQFALKVTLASMAAYVLYTSLDWPGIHTAMLTCLLVAQPESAGATVHKLTLRIIGAAVGAGLGIASIVFVLPQLETAGGLAVLVAAVTLLAAWVATARETISYAGWQIAFAFYLTVLQGFSRTSKMVVGRDRVIGILIGNLIMSVVFTTLWPAWSRTAVRRALSRAVQSLADALRRRAHEAVEAELAFDAELQKVKQSAREATFEGGGDVSASVRAIESLFVPIHALSREPLASGRRSQAEVALGEAEASAARWLSDLAAALPGAGPIPSFHAPARRAVEGAPDARLRAGWLRLLEERIASLAAQASALSRAETRS
jgi:multidrug resistance protein MdtO